MKNNKAIERAKQLSKDITGLPPEETPITKTVRLLKEFIRDNLVGVAREIDYDPSDGRLFLSGRLLISRHELVPSGAPVPEFLNCLDISYGKSFRLFDEDRQFRPEVFAEITDAVKALQGGALADIGKFIITPIREKAILAQHGIAK